MPTVLCPIDFTDLSRGAETGFEGGRSYRELKEEWNAAFERRFLAWLMRRSDGNISKAARDADMDRKYLHKLLRKHHIDSGSD